MRLDRVLTEQIIRRLVAGEDYRQEVVTLIDLTFLEFLFAHIGGAQQSKLAFEGDEEDWYESEMLSASLDKVEVAINAGLNMKTISNMYGTGNAETVRTAAKANFRNFNEKVIDLVLDSDLPDVRLSVKSDGVETFFTLAESVFLINALAVKRAAIRGGSWSTAGKRVEKPLMLTLCELYKVDERHFSIVPKGSQATDDEFEREIDFYLVSGAGVQQKCEVKLMGKGNPEVADAVIARHSTVFIADTLSETNRKQLNSLGIHWVELRSELGFRRFEKVLTALAIPFSELDDDFAASLDFALAKALS
jgi:hypothetical protein